MLAYRFFGYTFHVVCAILLLTSFGLELIGMQSQNLEFITIGMLGVVTGFMPTAAISDFVRHPYKLAFVYACYTIVITIWNVPFALLIVGVLLSLMVIYRVGISGGGFGAIRNEVSLLGKYSLFGYISQIAILQILSASSHHLNLRVAVLVISFIAAFVLTIASVNLVDRARARQAKVDRLYKAVFA